MLDGRATLRPNSGMLEFGPRPTLGELQRTTPWVWLATGYGNSLSMRSRANRSATRTRGAVMSIPRTHTSSLTTMNSTLLPSRAPIPSKSTRSSRASSARSAPDGQRVSTRWVASSVGTASITR